MILVRNAVESDLQRLAEIDNYYIQNTNVTFDVTPRTAEQRKPWFDKYRTTGPYQLLVAEDNGPVVGYSYSSRYREHFSFDQTVETSIYLAHDYQGKGVGSKLYTDLFSRLKNQSLHLAVVGIALPNDGSVAIHKKFGFEEVGVFKEYAFKNGTYISSIWMQKTL